MRQSERSAWKTLGGAVPCALHATSTCRSTCFHAGMRFCTHRGDDGVFKPSHIPVLNWPSQSPGGSPCEGVKKFTVYLWPLGPYDTWAIRSRIAKPTGLMHTGIKRTRYCRIRRSPNNGWPLAVNAKGGAKAFPVTCGTLLATKTHHAECAPRLLLSPGLATPSFKCPLAPQWRAVAPGGSLKSRAAENPAHRRRKPGGRPIGRQIRAFHTQGLPRFGKVVPQKTLNSAVKTIGVEQSTYRLSRG
jgi:hypothetical protein